MNKFSNQALTNSLSELKRDEKKYSIDGLKGFMQIIFVLSFLMLIFLAFAKANGI
jgi:hypothetical protein